MKIRAQYSADIGRGKVNMYLAIENEGMITSGLT